MSTGINFSLNELPNLIANTNYKPDLQTLIYIHGFHENQAKESVITIHDAYQSTGAYNIIMVDWAAGAAGNYVDAVMNAVAVNPDRFTPKNKI